MKCPEIFLSREIAETRGDRRKLPPLQHSLAANILMHVEDVAPKSFNATSSKHMPYLQACLVWYDFMQTNRLHKSSVRRTGTGFANFRAN